MPEHVVYTVGDALNTQCKPIKRSNILILGLAYEAMSMTSASRRVTS